MRIAVTGAGVVSPIGVGDEAFFAALADGRSAIGRRRRRGARARRSRRASATSARARTSPPATCAACRG